MKKLIAFVLLFNLLSCTISKKESFDKTETEKEIITSKPKKINQNPIDSTLIMLDTTTNLIWMKKDFSSIEKRFLSNWNEIFEWQQKMNSTNYAGFNDWRVPTIKEYRSINKNTKDREYYQKHYIELDSTSFWGKGVYAFWSSTTPNKNTASYMSFKKGFAVSGNREKIITYTKEHKGKSFGMSVRLVRN